MGSTIGKTGNISRSFFRHLSGEGFEKLMREIGSDRETISSIFSSQLNPANLLIFVMVSLGSLTRSQ